MINDCTPLHSLFLSTYTNLFLSLRVAGNAAYVLGTLAESDLGCHRVISLTNSKHPNSTCIMKDLSDMLLCEDAESVMNAAGTMEHW